MTFPPATPTGIPAPPGALLEARRLTRRDPLQQRAILQSVDFRLHDRERVAVMGPSGAGKSVFLRLLALLDPPDEGELLWRGAAIAPADIPAYRGHVAYVAQKPAVLDGRVEDNLRYPFSLKVHRHRRFDRDRVAELAARAGRGADFLDKRASELSGGEAQIMSLIRVLQLAPDVLLLDEPTASLDPDSARRIEALVTAWFEERTGAPSASASVSAASVSAASVSAASVSAAAVSAPAASAAAAPVTSAPAPGPMATRADAAPGAARACIWVSHDPAQALRVSTRRLTMQAGALREDAPGAPPGSTVATAPGTAAERPGDAR
ncbi:MAG: ABC transporter ATP-binding protein [Janthinobacterium lividum]